MRSNVLIAIYMNVRLFIDRVGSSRIPAQQKIHKSGRNIGATAEVNAHRICVIVLSPELSEYREI